MSSEQHDSSVVGRTAEPLSPWYKAISVISLLVAALCAVPAMYFIYEDINPSPGPDQVGIGSGTGLVLGGIAGSFSLAALASGILIPLLWRWGHSSAATVFAALAPATWGAVIVIASQFLAF